MTRCDDCGKEYGIGDWYNCPHGRVTPVSSGKDAYWDEHIDPSGKPALISNPGDKKKFLKRQWENDYQIQVVEKR